MMNIYFQDEDITTDDLHFLCYMIERVARKLHEISKNWRPAGQVAIPPHFFMALLKVLIE